MMNLALVEGIKGQHFVFAAYEWNLKRRLKSELTITTIANNELMQLVIVKYKYKRKYK